MIKDSGQRTYNGKLNKQGDKRGCRITHGLSKERIYKVWTDMKRRCKNPKNKRYSRYGARGISVCEEWERFENFYEWAMSNGYSDCLSLERKNVDGNYCPENCEWIPLKLQQRNTSRSHFVTANGQTKTIAEWAEITGISQDTIKDRLNKLGWSEQEAVTIPTLKVGKKRWQL